MKAVRYITFYCWQASGVYPPQDRPENWGITFEHTAAVYVHDRRGPCEVFRMRDLQRWDYITLYRTRRKLVTVYGVPWRDELWFAPRWIAPFVIAVFVVRDMALRQWNQLYHRATGYRHNGSRAPWPRWASFGL